MNYFWDDPAVGFNVKEYEPGSLFKSPNIEPGKFLSVETIYEEIGLGHHGSAKDDFEFIGWYVNEDGHAVFGNRDDFVCSNQETAEIMYRSDNYISKMKEIAGQYPV